MTHITKRTDAKKKKVGSLDSCDCSGAALEPIIELGKGKHLMPLSLCQVPVSFSRSPGNKLHPFKLHANIRNGAYARIQVPAPALFNTWNISKKGNERSDPRQGT